MKKKLIKKSVQPIIEKKKKKILVENIKKNIEKKVIFPKVKDSKAIENFIVPSTVKVEEKNSPSLEKEYIQKNLAKIRELLQENLYYPRRARKRGIEGKVLVSFKLAPDASVSDIKVLSYTNDILRRGAIKTISDLAFQFPKPKESLNLKVPIYYKLQ